MSTALSKLLLSSNLGPRGSALKQEAADCSWRTSQSQSPSWWCPAWSTQSRCL